MTSIGLDLDALARRIVTDPAIAPPSKVTSLILDEARRVADDAELPEPMRGIAVARFAARLGGDLSALVAFHAALRLIELRAPASPAHTNGGSFK